MKRSGAEKQVLEVVRAFHTQVMEPLHQDMKKGAYGEGNREAPYIIDDDASKQQIGGVMEQFTRQLAFGKSFVTPEAAAKDILDKINPTSIDKNIEYAGIIYEQGGKYYASKPVTNRKGDEVKPYRSKYPSGATVAGTYHTHGDYSAVGNDGKPKRVANSRLDEYGSDGFSAQDEETARRDAARWGNLPNYRDYLGTPSGIHQWYNPYTDKSGVLQ